MNLYSKTRLFMFAGSLVLALCASALAQQSADLASPDQTMSTSAPQKATATQTPSGTLFASSDLSDSKWHFYGTGYIWISGIHGTVGIRGFDASVHVTAGDIFRISEADSWVCSHLPTIAFRRLSISSG
jgi:hypothetical protein